MVCRRPYAPSRRGVLLLAAVGLLAIALWSALGTSGRAQGPTPVLETALLVSVKSFGAVGDGRTDDRTAVVAALKSGHAVFFPKGTYRIDGPIDFGALRQREGLTQPSVMLVGEGPAISRLVYTGTGTMLTGGRTAPQTGGYEQRLSIRNLSLSGTVPRAPKPVRTLGLFHTTPSKFAGTASTQTGIYWEFGGSSVIEGAEFENFGTALSTKAGYGLTVRNSVFQYNGIALLLSQAVTTLSIEQNLIERNDIGIGLWIASQIGISKNILQGNYGGADIVSYNWNTQISIDRNYFEASPVAFFHAGDSEGQYVSNNYSFLQNKGLTVRIGALARSFYFDANRIESFECAATAANIVLTRNADDRKDGLAPFTAVHGAGASTACTIDDSADRAGSGSEKQGRLERRAAHGTAH